MKIKKKIITKKRKSKKLLVKKNENTKRKIFLKKRALLLNKFYELRNILKKPIRGGSRINRERQKVCNLIRKKYLHLKNFVYFLYVKKLKKNFFANFSNIKGDVIFKASSGCYNKKALRKTFFATNFLFSRLKHRKVLNKMLFNRKKKKKKRIVFFLNILGNDYSRGFKKNIKSFVKGKKKTIRFFKISEISYRAHNGVRPPKKRRK